MADEKTSSLLTGDHGALRDLLCRVVCCVVLGTRVFSLPVAVAPVFHLFPRGLGGDRWRMVGVTGFEPAASSSRTSRNRNHVGH
jgi:hypothetical protein